MLQLDLAPLCPAVVTLAMRGLARSLRRPRAPFSTPRPQPRAGAGHTHRVTTGCRAWLGPKQCSLPRPRSPVLPMGFLPG